MNCKHYLNIIILLILIPSVNASDAVPFISPDNSYQAVKSFLKDAGSIYISAYTFTSPHIMDFLIEGKPNATILVEDNPVGGISRESKEILCELQKSGINVFLYKGGLRFFHAKYMIKDNSSILVSTENFGASGYSPERGGNRGWGIIAEDREAAGKLLDIFFSDLEKSEEFECGIDYEIEKRRDAVLGHGLPIYKNQKIEVVSAPDAVDDLVGLIKSAKKSIYIEQFYIYKHWGPVKSGSPEKEPNLFLEEAIEKAREGIEVKVLLDGSYYNIDKGRFVSNYYTEDYINKIAEEEGLNLEAKIANPRDLGVSKIHTKGVIIDNRSVLISSINWNENSPRHNREVGLIVSGDVAGYYTGGFLNVWNHGIAAGYTGSFLKEGYANSIISLLFFVLVVCAFFYAVSKRRHF